MRHGHAPDACRRWPMACNNKFKFSTTERMILGACSFRLVQYLPVSNPELVAFCFVFCFFLKKIYY
eukprot:SAG31_NODE_2600_length_5414_cov_3.077140_10_plen_66_part_00